MLCSVPPDTASPTGRHTRDDNVADCTSYAVLCIPWLFCDSNCASHSLHLFHPHPTPCPCGNHRLLSVSVSFSATRGSYFSYRWLISVSASFRPCVCPARCLLSTASHLRLQFFPGPAWTGLEPTESVPFPCGGPWPGPGGERSLHTGHGQESRDGVLCQPGRSHIYAFRPEEQGV